MVWFLGEHLGRGHTRRGMRGTRDSRATDTQEYRPISEGRLALGGWTVEVA
jgi:hypothetical protein